MISDFICSVIFCWIRIRNNNSGSLRIRWSLGAIAFEKNLNQIYYFGKISELFGLDLIAFNFWNKPNNCWCVCAVGGRVWNGPNCCENFRMVLTVCAGGGRVWSGPGELLCGGPAAGGQDRGQRRGHRGPD